MFLFPQKTFLSVPVSGSRILKSRSPSWTTSRGPVCWIPSETGSFSSARKRSCWRNCSTSNPASAPPATPRRSKRRRSVWRRTCRQHATARAKLSQKGEGCPAEPGKSRRKAGNGEKRCFRYWRTDPSTLWCLVLKMVSSATEKFGKELP